MTSLTNKTKLIRPVKKHEKIKFEKNKNKINFYTYFCHKDKKFWGTPLDSSQLKTRCTVVKVTDNHHEQFYYIRTYVDPN